MSLIERAVTRLGGNPPVFPQPEEPGVGETGAVASEPKLSSIERLMASACSTYDGLGSSS